MGIVANLKVGIPRMKPVQKVWAFEGTPVSSAEAVEDAQSKYGKACADWKTSKTDNKNYKSPNGKSETKNPECGGVPYWFPLGIYTLVRQVGQNMKALLKSRLVYKIEITLTNNKQGKYVYGPTPVQILVGKWFGYVEDKRHLVLMLITQLHVFKELARQRKLKEEEEKRKIEAEQKRKEEEEKKKQVKEVYKDKYSGQEKKCPGSKPRFCNNPRRAAGNPECKCWL